MDSSPLDPRLSTGRARARAKGLVNHKGKRPPKAERSAANHRERVIKFVEHYKATGDIIEAVAVSRLSRGQAREIVAAHPELREDICLTLARAGATPERVIKEIARIALCDPRQMMDESGNVRPMNEWPEDIARAVAGFDATQRSYGDDEHEVKETTYKPRFWDKPAMLRELVRMLRMGGTEVESGGGSSAATVVQKIEVVIVSPGEASKVGPIGLIQEG